MSESMVMTISELCEELHISRPTASALTRRADFPTLHLGRRVLISREGLRNWIEANSNNLN